LSRKSDGFCEAVTLSETKGPATVGKNQILRLRLRMTNDGPVFVQKVHRTGNLAFIP